MSKYTPEISQKIIDLIKEGNFASIAYGACGISKDTFYSWIKRYPDFADSIKKAKAERITSLIKAIKNDSSFQSKAWMLERLDREKYHLDTRSDRETREDIALLKDEIQKLKVKQMGGVIDEH